jgi:putative peptidoglycan lipid II flippase
VARSAASAGAATLTSRVLGVARESVIAWLFGAGEAMDAYRVAFRIPNLLRDLFAEGAMSAAFVPTFTQRLASGGRDAALRLGLNVTNALIVITAVLVIAGMVFAEPLVRLLVEDEFLVTGQFATGADKLALTVFLARVMLPFLTFIALAAAAMGMLNALQHFFVPAVSPAMFNVASIAAALGLVPVMVWLGLHPVTALAVGTLAGGFAQWAVQWPLLRRSGFRYRPSLDWSDDGLRRVLLLMGPGTLGLAATQVNVLVNTHLATGQGEGAVSWLDYAFRLMYLPIGLFGVSVATATTPAISRLLTAGDRPGVRRTIADSISLMLMLNAPATVGLFLLAGPIVRVMYERGLFTATDTAATALAVQWYALGLVGYSVARIVSPVFYALDSPRTPVKVSVATVAVNATLNIMLVRTVGYAGLALGTSIAALFNATALLWLLRRRLHGIDGGQLAGASGRILIASAAMGAAVFALDAYLPAVLPGQGFAAVAVRLAVTIAGALAVLAGVAHLLRIREYELARGMVLRRLRRSGR